MRVLTIFLAILGASSAAFAQEDYGDPDDVGSLIIVEDHSLDGQQQDVGDDGSSAYWYYGTHPDPDGGYDATEGPHQHEYPPIDPYLFTQENGYYYFIGDPVDFGYQGQDVYPYYGPHPVAIAYGGGYCYYGGTHRHRFAPFSNRFGNSNGWYVWQGPVSPWFAQHRDMYAQYFRTQYPRHFRQVNGTIVRVHEPRMAYRPPVQRMKVVPRGPTVVVPSRPARQAPPPTRVRDHRH